MAKSLPLEVLQLIFNHLTGDSQTLALVGLVCHSWRRISLRHWLKEVDLSSHNNGRVPEEEDPGSLITGVIMSDYSDRYRLENLVPRQRAFLRLMVERPELKTYVQTLIWTLVWLDFYEEDLAGTDLKLWDVFASMENVTRLDLASLHEIWWQKYIRQNPPKLFPAVTHLRLVGWMHRGLVKAIVASLDASKLVQLQLDHLQDEGALPNGEPMQDDLARQNRRYPADPYSQEGIVSDELLTRQEQGDIAIFPGPMWLPLRLLRRSHLASMVHFEVKLGPFSDAFDSRNDITLFHEVAKFIQRASDTLKTICIRVGESPTLNCTEEELGPGCGTSMVRLRYDYRPMCFDLTSVFLHRLLKVLTEEEFPQLARVDLAGFRIIRNGTSQLAQPPDPDLTWQLIRDCPFIDSQVLETPNVDFRLPFAGYTYPSSEIDQDKLEELEDILKIS